MSRLYGVVSHAKICKLFKKYKKKSFCECCLVNKKKTCLIDKIKQKKKYPNKQQELIKTLLKDFNSEMFQFLENNHLSVHAIEKKIFCDGLTGRVDCIFRENINKKKLFIIDWKFCNNIPTSLHLDYELQLNLYMYIMKRMKIFSNYDFEMYCFIFSSHDNNKIRIFKCKVLPEGFIQNLISIISF